MMFKQLRYRLIDLARGTRSVDLLAELRRLQFEDRQHLEAREDALLSAYLANLRAAVPMFANVQRLDDLPILDKRFINEHRGALLNPAHTGKLVRKKTGGSTGEPLVYFTGAESQSYLWAGIFLAWEAAGFKLGDRVAFLAGSSLFGTGYKQRVYYRLLNVSLFSAFDMDPVRLTSYAANIADGRFRLLYGYASAVHQLALHVLASGKAFRSALRGVVCTAETLTPKMRADIESAFGVPCFSQYGCNDAGVSAFECERRDGFHLLSTRCHAEVLPDGRFIATDMSNQAMFMPRYDTGDLVRMSGRSCACGRSLPLIDEVIGRQNDVVTDPRGSIVHSEFFTHLFREDARIHSFQVLFDDHRLVANLHGEHSGGPDSRAVLDSYRARIGQSLTFDAIEFVFNEPFHALPNAKHRFVMRRPAA